MKSSVSIEFRKCCGMEKKRLMQELRECDYCESTYKGHRACYSKTAKDSGDRSKSCIVG